MPIGVILKLGHYLLLSCLLWSTASLTAGAEEVYEINTSVRALGMGNAYLGVVRDSDSLYYNPAGLARVSGFNFTIADPKAGVSGIEAYEDIQDAQDSSTFETAIRDLYGDRVWAAAGGKVALVIPYFGLGVYNNLDASLDVQNPVYPNLDVNVINDYGYVMGFGVPVLPTLHFGINMKRIKRTGTRAPFGASFIGTLDPENIKNSVDKHGVAYGFDIATNLAIPLPAIDIVFAGVWKNVGGLSFKSDNEDPPPIQEQEMAIGAAINVDLPLISITPAIDFKHINREDIQLGKKAHLGLEIGIPFFDFRAGLHQGYYTLGAGFNMGLIRVDAATYGVEVGEYAGQREDRRYIVQASLELGFDPGFSFLGGGSGGGGNKSSSRGRRLKQRR